MDVDIVLDSKLLRLAFPLILLFLAACGADRLPPESGLDRISSTSTTDSAYIDVIKHTPSKGVQEVGFRYCDHVSCRQLGPKEFYTEDDVAFLIDDVQGHMISSAFFLGTLLAPGGYVLSKHANAALRKYKFFFNKAALVFDKTFFEDLDVLKDILKKLQKELQAHPHISVEVPDVLLNARVRSPEDGVRLIRNLSDLRSKLAPHANFSTTLNGLGRSQAKTLEDLDRIYAKKSPNLSALESLIEDLEYRFSRLLDALGERANVHIEKEHKDPLDDKFYRAQSEMLTFYLWTIIPFWQNLHDDGNIRWQFKRMDLLNLNTIFDDKQVDDIEAVAKDLERMLRKIEV